MVNMIRVDYNKKIIKISGHAGYAEAGKDIVCASVSSIIYTTVNGIMNLNKDAIRFTDNNDIMEITLINNDDNTLKLIDNMLELLQELQRQYPDKICLSKGE